MATQGEALAATVEEVSGQLVAMIESCPDSRWAAKTPAEGWTVAAAAHHAAGSLGSTTQLALAVAKGMPLPPLTWDMINAGNAQESAQYAACSKADAIALARKEGAAAAAILRGLSDAELQQTAELSLLGQTVSAAQVAQMVVIGHTTEHMASIRATA